MKLSRLLLPLLFALSLLTAQQAGAAHAVHHALAEQSQQDKQAPHSPACEKCATYAQLGSALNVAAFDFTPPASSGATQVHFAAGFRSIDIPAATARGPPAFLRS